MTSQSAFLEKIILRTKKKDGPSSSSEDPKQKFARPNSIPNHYVPILGFASFVRHMGISLFFSSTTANLNLARLWGKMIPHFNNGAIVLFMLLSSLCLNRRSRRRHRYRNGLHLV